MRRSVLACLVLLAFAFGLPRLHAQGYAFTKIVDDEGPWGSFFGSLSINDQGQVAFVAREKAGGGRFYLRGDGGPLVTIADVTAIAGSPLSLTGPTISDEGVVAFSLTASIGRSFVYAGSGDEPRVVASSTSERFAGVGMSAVNGRGDVAFVAQQRSGGSGLFLASGGEITTLLLSTDFPITFNLTDLELNEAGEIAFPNAFPGRLVKVSNGEAAVVADATNLDPDPTAIDSLSLSDAGSVAFAVQFSQLQAPPAGASGLFVGDGEMLNTLHMESLQPSGTPVLRVDRVATNAAEELAIMGEMLGAPGMGDVVLDGPDPVENKVIGLGDPLFGSTVISLNQDQEEDQALRGGQDFLNDRGQIAFRYELANGVSGIAVATPVSPPPTPDLPADSVVDAASFIPAGEPGHSPAPGSIVSVFGAHFASELTLAESSPLPVALDGVSVTFDGIEAPLYFVAAEQINAQLPFEILGDSVEVVVTNAVGAGMSRTLSVAATSPSVFTFDQSGAGQGIVVFANTATLAGPNGLTPDSRPAGAGDVLTVFANGLGAVTPPIESGRNSCDPDGVCLEDFSNLVLREALARPSIEVGGVAVPDGDVVFAGLAPQFVGLYQINFLLPPGVAPGDAVPIVIRQGGSTSRGDVTIAVE